MRTIISTIISSVSQTLYTASTSHQRNVRPVPLRLMPFIASSGFVEQFSCLSKVLFHGTHDEADNRGRRGLCGFRGVASQKVELFRENTVPSAHTRPSSLNSTI